MALFLSLTMAPAAYSHENNVTPYGDYCKGCAFYGACRTVLTRQEALMNLDKYYRDRGYKVGNVYHRGRFIEADIYKEERQVDRVIFDRKTGRLRSIY